MVEPGSKGVGDEVAVSVAGRDPQTQLRLFEIEDPRVGEDLGIHRYSNIVPETSPQIRRLLLELDHAVLEVDFVASGYPPLPLPKSGLRPGGTRVRMEARLATVGLIDEGWEYQSELMELEDAKRLLRDHFDALSLPDCHPLPRFDVGSLPAENAVDAFAAARLPPCNWYRKTVGGYVRLRPDAEWDDWAAAEVTRLANEMLVGQRIRSYERDGDDLILTLGNQHELEVVAMTLNTTKDIGELIVSSAQVEHAVCSSGLLTLSFGPHTLTLGPNRDRSVRDNDRWIRSHSGTIQSSATDA